MAIPAEISLFWDFIARSVDRIFACMDGFTGDDLNWQPIDSANSLYVLAAHTMGNLEDNILRVWCGQSGERDRVAEFAAQGADDAELRAYWQELQARVNAALATLAPPDLDRTCIHHRRGTITGREILIVVARHAAEHMGHAELTRDLLRATRS